MKLEPKQVLIAIACTGIIAAGLPGCASPDRKDEPSLTGKDAPAEKARRTELTSHRVGRNQHVQHRPN